MSAYCTRLASTRHDKRAESAGSLGATGAERATGMDAAMDAAWYWAQAGRVTAAKGGRAEGRDKGRLAAGAWCGGVNAQIQTGGKQIWRVVGVVNGEVYVCVRGTGPWSCGVEDQTLEGAKPRARDQTTWAPGHLHLGKDEEGDETRLSRHKTEVRGPARSRVLDRVATMMARSLRVVFPQHMYIDVSIAILQIYALVTS